MPQVKSIVSEVTYDLGGNNAPNTLQFDGRHLPLGPDGDFGFLFDVGGFANISQVWAHVSDMVIADAALRGLTISANEIIWMVNFIQG